MIKKLSVKNFKSIKELEIDCRKINLFIGEPNTGKSNILETLGLLSWFGYNNAPLTEYIRFQSMQDLFCSGDFIDQSVEIKIDIERRTGLAGIGIDTKIEFQGDRFLFFAGARLKDGGSDTLAKGSLDYSGEGSRSGNIPDLKSIKPCMFDKQTDFQWKESSFLMPPHGSNMFAVVMGNKRLRELMSQFFEDYGFKLVLKPREKTFEILKLGQGVIFSYPYILTPDTLQRMIFYTIAMESNENSTLVFEEPESHTFPYYTKFLGEKIALDESNQYFIATHNPYFLLSVLEKAPEDDVNVFIAQLKDYQTKVKRLDDEEVSELMDYDPFFNLDSFIEDEEENAEEDEEELQ